MVRRVAGNRSTQLHSNAISAQSDSQERTIFVHIFAHIRTNDPLFVQSAVKRSHVSTIASATKVFIRARRSSSVKATYRAAQAGAVGADLLVQMLWVDTSDQKLDESASSLCLTRKPLKGKKHGLKNSSRRKLPQVWLHLNL